MTGRWLVTGGAGAIGGHLVRRLVAAGQPVTVLDNLSTGCRSNLPSTGDVALVEGDCSDADAVRSAMRQAACVVHCAATVDVQRCITDWLGAHRSNLTGTLQVFDEARRHERLPVVYASSAAVYGDRSDDICHEDLPERPISPYGADKLAAESQARAFWRIHDLPTAGLRFFNVYGERERGPSPYSGVLARFVRNVARGDPHVIYGDGGQTRDFVWVDDVVGAILAAMETLRRRPQCMVSNVCTGRSVSVLDLAALVDDASGRSRPPPLFQPARPGEIRHSRGDRTRMDRLLRPGPMMRLEEGLRRSLSGIQAVGKVS